MGMHHTVSVAERNSVAARCTKKPEVQPYTPTSHVERQEARARYRANVAAILPLVEAGAAVLPLAGKQPLAVRFQRLDTEMTAERRAEALDGWRADRAGREDREPSHGFGATRSPERVKGWPRVADELAFGLSLGAMNVQVVDCDDAEGATFLAFLAEHGEALDLARTPATMSPGRNGRHFYFANPEGCGGRKLAGLSLDLKAHGGQVVAPGQTLPPKFGEDGQLIPARTYVPVPGSLDLAEAICTNAFPPLPACLIAYMLENSASRGSATDAEAIAEAADLLDAGPAGDKPERDVGAMVEMLRAESPAFDTLWRQGSPKADRSAGRIALANRMAARFGSRDFDALDLRDTYALWGVELAGEPRDRDVAREWGKAVVKGNVGATDGAAFGSVEAVEPERDTEDQALADLFGFDAAGVAELRQRDKDAAREAAKLAGIEVEAVEDDGPLPAAQQAIRDALNAKANRRPVYDRDVTLGSLPPLQYLVDGLVVLGEVVIAAGAPGAGKSADLLHLGRCVAAGKPYHGRETERAGVLFCSSENPTEDARRALAHRHRYGDEPGLPFAVERSALSLYDAEGKPTADERYIIATAKGMQAATGHACRLIILDNARRIIAPGDTSKEPDTVQLMKAVERIRDATGAAVIVIAHTVRDGTRYAGSGAIESSADSVWHYEAAVLAGATRRAAGKDVKLKTAPAYIRFDKMRTGDRNQRIEYALPVETIGEDSKGRPVKVVVSADLPTSSASHGATDGAAFGVVEDSEDDAAALGELPAAPAPQAEPDAPDPRKDAIMAALADLGTGGATFQATAVLDAANAKLTARDRKAPRMSLRSLQIALAELKEDGSVVRTGTGKLTAYSLPPKASE